jgi:NAD(P)-dependent dehydrogenase (short-subunit alcohol dehydrogenase family)
LKALKLIDQVAVITGGGGGLGRAICLVFAQAGATIVVTDMRVESMNEVTEEVIKLGQKAIGIRCDVTKSIEVNQMVDKAIAEFGRVDILVNNAGIVREQQPKPIWEITDQEWHLGIDTNLTGAFFCCRAIAKHMIERGKGTVINMASGAGIRGISDQFMYCSAKAGIILLTQSLALTWATYGIRVNAIAPGTVRTFRSSEEYEKRGRFVPMGRVGEPEDISHLALYLASDASSYITGQVFIVDGGSMAGGFAPIDYAPIMPFEE